MNGNLRFPVKSNATNLISARVINLASAVAVLKTNTSFSVSIKETEKFTQRLSKTSKPRLDRQLSKVKSVSIRHFIPMVFAPYDSIVPLGYQKHFRIYHQDNYAVGDVHINGMEGFWRYAKVRLVKFRGLSKNTFYLHLKECEFRFNYRNHDLYKMLLKISKNIIFC